jgi:hypothetical protein
VGKLFGSCGFEAGEPVHRDHVNAMLPLVVLSGQPGLEYGFGPSWNNIQQACGAGAIAHGGEIHDDGDVFVAGAGMPPYVFVYA